MCTNIILISLKNSGLCINMYHIVQNTCGTKFLNQACGWRAPGFLNHF